MSSPARFWSASTVLCASRNCSRKWTSSSAVSSGRPHRPLSYQRGRGHEPVTVAGSIRSLVAVSIGRAPPGRGPGGAPILDRRAAADRSARRVRRRQASKSQRVAPCGSAPATPNARFGVNSYRYHGGGPALGALYGAVKASPSTDAGQPPSLYFFTRRSSVSGRSRGSLRPRATRSRSVSVTEKTQSDRSARFRLLRVRAAHEPEPVVEPDRADTRDVRPPVGTDRAEEEGRHRIAGSWSCAFARDHSRVSWP